MSEYRRFVAYIYEYTNGKKNKNTGFAKVESRNGVCRMQIHLQKIPREEKALNIYGFVREGGWLLGILLGKICVQGSGGEARIQTPAGNIGGSGYALSQLAGMWVESGQGRTYLTVFDDEGIDTARLVKELPETVQKEEEKEAKSGEEEAEAKSGEEEAEAKSGEEDAEAKNGEEEAEARSGEEEAEAKSSEEKAEAKSSEEDAEAKNSEEDAGEAKSCVAEEMESLTAEEEKTGIRMDTEEAHTEEREEEERTERRGAAAAGIHKEEAAEEYGRKDTEETAKEDTGRSEPDMEGPETPEASGEQTDFEKGETAGKEEEKGSEQLHAQGAAACQAPGCLCRSRQMHPAGLDQKWKMLSGRCPHFSPFADEELADCIQITPRELHVIRQGNYRMGNNSFLMHGFCNYRHLLFGRLRNGGYLLGIPGIFENQELFMANMFGFPEFKEAASRSPQGRFGYWCRRL